MSARSMWRTQQPAPPATQPSQWQWQAKLDSLARLQLSRAHQEAKQRSYRDTAASAAAEERKPAGLSEDDWVPRGLRSEVDAVFSEAEIAALRESFLAISEADAGVDEGVSEVAEQIGRGEIFKAESEIGSADGSPSSRKSRDVSRSRSRVASKLARAVRGEHGVTREQLHHALKASGFDNQEFVDNAFAVWDTDGDNLINWREFLAAMTMLSGGRGSDSTARARAVFQLFDLNGDGSIDRQELETVLKLAASTSGKEDSDAAGPASDADIHARASELFEAMDLNHDGKISLAEFIAGAEKHGLFNVGPQVQHTLEAATSSLRKEQTLMKFVDDEFMGDFEEFWLFLTGFIHHHAAFAPQPNQQMLNVSQQLQTLPEQRELLASSGASLPIPSAKPERLAISMRFSTVAKQLAHAQPLTTDTLSNVSAIDAAAGANSKHAQLSLVQLLTPGKFSATSLDAFSRMFKHMDTANLGVVTREQFVQAFDSLGLRDQIFVDHLFTIWDTDKSGALDYKEFMVALCALSAQGVTEDEKLRIVFDMFDTDDDGFIDKHELTRALMYAEDATGVDADKNFDARAFVKRVDEIFAKADADGDGHISREEFNHFAKESALFSELPDVALLVENARVKGSRSKSGLVMDDNSARLLRRTPPLVEVLYPGVSAKRVQSSRSFLSAIPLVSAIADSSFAPLLLAAATGAGLMFATLWRTQRHISD